jgi:hypothetical protein
MSVPAVPQNYGVPATVDPSLPEYLQQLPSDQDTGMDLMAQYVKPPRLKIVQPQSKGVVKERFNDGDVIVVPQMVKVAGVKLNEHNKPSMDKQQAGEPFVVVPLFFYPEFAIWNPYTLSAKGDVPMIRERTTDENSEIASIARNFNKRNQPYPNPKNEAESKMEIKYVEHLNFVLALVNHELFDTPVIQSFSRSDFNSGVSFIQDIRMRRKPIWACQFQAYTRYRENDQSQWYGMVMTNPAVGVNQPSPWVQSPELAQYFESMHTYFKELHASKQLQAEYDDSDAATVAGAGASNINNAPDQGGASVVDAVPPAAGAQY